MRALTETISGTPSKHANQPNPQGIKEQCVRVCQLTCSLTAGVHSSSIICIALVNPLAQVSAYNRRLFSMVERSCCAHTHAQIYTHLFVVRTHVCGAVYLLKDRASRPQVFASCVSPHNASQMSFNVCIRSHARVLGPKIQLVCARVR